MLKLLVLAESRKKKRRINPRLTDPNSVSPLKFGPLGDPTNSAPSELLSVPEDSGGGGAGENTTG